MHQTPGNEFYQCRRRRLVAAGSGVSGAVPVTTAAHHDASVMSSLGRVVPVTVCCGYA